MSKEKIDIQKLFEGLDKGILNEETQQKVTELIEETVNARVQAKELLLKEEVEKIKTDLAAEKEKLLTEAQEKEKVLVEQAELFKKELEDTTIEETLKYKKLLEEKAELEISTKTKELEAFQAEAAELVLKEAQDFKTKHQEKLAEDVKNFKAGLVEKIDAYLEAKVTEMIPTAIMESATKLAVLEPLVTGIMESFSKNYVKLDTTSYSVIKEAQTKISTLEAALEQKTKDEVKIKNEKLAVERLVKLNSLTEGLTKVQKEKAVKLLEGVDGKELESRFTKIRDIIIESTSQVSKPVVKPLTESEQKSTVVSQADKAVLDHQLKRVITESEQKTIVTGAKAVETTKTPSSHPQANAWAGRIKPGYIDSKTK